MEDFNLRMPSYQRSEGRDRKSEDGDRRSGTGFPFYRMGVDLILILFLLIVTTNI